MPENKIKPEMDQNFFTQRFDETNVGFRANMAMNSAAQAIEDTKLRTAIERFVPNDQWREIILAETKKTGALTLDNETAAILEKELSKGERAAVTKDSSVDKILDFLEEKRTLQQEWREKLVDLKGELSERYYDRLGFWARDKNVKGFFTGETAEDQQYRLGNVQYDKEQNLDGIKKRLDEYQNAHYRILGERDPRFDLTNKDEKQRAEILEQFYNEILRSPEHEQKQFERMLKNESKVVDYESHPEAARYHFLQQAFNNPELVDENVREIIKAIKEDPNIAEEDKVKAFLTVSDNNLVRDQLLDPSESLYYDPNFSFTYEREMQILRDANLMPSEHQDNVFNTLYSDPLKSISLSLPVDLQATFNKVVESYENSVNGIMNNETTKPSLDQKDIDKICESLPDDMKSHFQQICEDLDVKLPEHLSALKFASESADETQLNNLQLSKINEATQSMLDMGKNEENTITLTNNQTLEQKQELTQEMQNKLGYPQRPQLKMSR